ncbi:Hcp1 family type VI secretion system effector [Paramixta manurensis]|uniref:Hcp1 family type VI secretion system effector n=1 Tax=Paramixta manurensis TaxID=2740817 RepID=A0A6M8UH60_9GAMM|nr:Hcp1 family type VI secretion system effector [Erwiniaceae bacterium PD-1]
MNNVFLKMAGVTGESKDAAHEGWTDAVTYTWGSRRDDNGSGPGKTSFTNLVVHCRVDKATPGALLYSANGNKIAIFRQREQN